MRDATAHMKSRALNVDGCGYRVDSAAIAKINVYGEEVIQRIFVTVRDRNWQEIPPSEWRNEVEDLGREVKLWSRCKSKDIDFEWAGTFHITDERTQFSIEGRVLQQMEVCRLGIVVLLPVPPLIGACIHAEGPGGSDELMISQYLHPQPILNGVPQSMLASFSTLICSFPRGRLLMRFSGDLFELEDQRNWGDASFKVYCTPLRLGFPRLISKGSLVRQSVEASFIKTASCHSTEPREQPALRKSVFTGSHGGAEWNPDPILTDKLATRRIPKIGRIAPGTDRASVDQEWMLGWDHIQVDWDHTKPETIAQLVTALPASTMLELAIRISEESELSSEISSFLNGNSKRICKLVLRDATLPLPTNNAIARLRKELALAGARDIPLVVVPNGFFVELNRGKPFDIDVDGMAFPLSSTVHSDDIGTIVDNIAAVSDMVATARKLTGKSEISISPLALYLSERSTATRFPRHLVVPWLMSIVARASQAAVASITLASDVIDNLTADVHEFEKPTNER